MKDEYTQIKELVIEELVKNIEGKKEIAKEFGLTEGKLDELILKLADRWLTSPDHVIMIASLLGISVPRKQHKDRSSGYIG